ncbi:hypothetical protein K8354_10150 [Polaribacter litorisediminis]|uniref:hypothetical protein n=1 Tax=Polaribacter litorisediminis TaxID=1908341 RepID=UPI001CC0544A|nr:hypothetical protein [Polaribacter litorisediminis]UAM96699.1 hypothetical protein K8354_10150 [Polaribacter litorisediminis]
MENKELLESLNSVAEVLIAKIEQKKIKEPVTSFINTKEEVNIENINIIKIIIGGLVTAIVGCGIAYFTNGNLILYSFIGAFIGVISSYFSQKKKQNSETDSNQTSVDYDQYKNVIINDIRNVNNEIRDEWEIAMQLLNDKQSAQINQMPWPLEQKQLALNETLIYKSLIISDYHYTDAIEDLEINENFSNNINQLFTKWKNGIIEIINNTKNEQWETYYSKIYIS